MSKEVFDILSSFFSTEENPTLFAGAGVSARAGCPTWSEFINRLAEFTEQYDRSSAELMRERAIKGQMIEAAAIYRTCREIPEGQKYDKLAEPFLNPAYPERISPLSVLPFRFFVTTNYDRALHDSYSRVTGKAPMQVELGDETMARAPWTRAFYIARIHGRVEVPRSIVLDDADFRDLEKNDCYIEFLRHVFTNTSCLFMGYSFLDPAIDFVFRMIEKRLLSNFPALHLAILPADAHPDLVARLLRFNIRCSKYDPADNHNALWESIESLSGRLKSALIEYPRFSSRISPDTIRSFTATSYARSKLEKESGPFRDNVVEGILIDIVSRFGDTGISKARLSTELSKYFTLTAENLSSLIKKRIDSLSGQGLIIVSDDTIRLGKQQVNVLDSDLSMLVEGVVNRYKVRESKAVFDGIETLIKTCIEQIILARGWDLGAHYAGATADLPNILDTIKYSALKLFADLDNTRKEALTLSIFDLFRQPDPSESAILAELGRISFALQLVLRTPCAAIAQQTVIPDSIYLDASYLLPLIAEGHPFQTIYHTALDQLRTAGLEKGSEIKVCVLFDFLNEIVAHRELAAREADAIGLDRDPSLIEKIISYSGADNTNVFLGAFGNLRATAGYEKKFDQYLKEYAPYQTEEQLVSFLARKYRIDAIKVAGKEQDRAVFEELYSALEGEYAKQDIRKERVLIRHEAKQLFQIQVEQKIARQPLFVTADMKLMRLSRGPILGAAGKVIISNRAFVQLVDMLIGLKADPDATVRLFWGGPINDDYLHVRDYLIWLGLKLRDEAMAMALPEVLQVITNDALESAKKNDVRLGPRVSEHDEIQRTRHLESVEDKFYKNMADTIEKKYPGYYNFPKKMRKELIEKNIQNITEQLELYDKKLSAAKEAKEIGFIKSEMSQLARLLDQYKSELANDR